MVAVHTLVAEVLSDFIDALEAAYDESLQIELGGDTHVHILVERIEVSDEWAGRSTTCDALQGRSLHLCITSVVKHTAQGAQYCGTLQEGVLHAVVDDEVDIALAIAQLWVIELVVSHAVLVLHDREWLEALGEQAQLLGVNRDLAGLCAEDETLDADEVTDVEQFFEYRIVKVLVLVGTDFVAGDIDLYSSLRILQLGEACLAHHASAHHTACDHYLAWLVLVFELSLDVCAECIGWKLCCWVWVDAHLSQCLKTLSANYFLFAQL